MDSRIFTVFFRSRRGIFIYFPVAYMFRNLKKYPLTLRILEIKNATKKNTITEVMESGSAVLGTHTESHWKHGKSDMKTG